MSTAFNPSAGSPSNLSHYENFVVHNHSALPAVQISAATIAGVHSTRIIYQGRVICLTQQLAQFYGCDQEHILDNHRKNSERFEEGKHFVRVDGDAFRAFKAGLPENIREPLKFAPKAILWTEMGAARHAKMLSTDRAWDVFEQLEEAYFRQAGQHTLALPNFADPVSAARAWADAKEGEQKAVADLALAAPKVEFFDKVVERSTLMTASQIGQKLGMSAIKLNKRLDELGVYSLNVKRARVFKQWVIDKGYGELKQTELGFSQPLFTTAGEAWIVERLTSEGVA